jgi:hypothetical protein
MREWGFAAGRAGLNGKDGVAAPGEACWLCARPLGRRIEWHHPVPRSRGGRERVPLHPICHRTIHANFSNAELERSGEVATLREHPAVANFLRWIAGKPADFHARTASRRERR